MVRALEGRTFPDRPYRICVQKVVEFTDVTGDDARRWTESAPPGFASAILFVVAPELLAEVEGPVIHADQSFSWIAPLPLEADVAVSGTVDRVRTREDTAFVVFSFRAVGDAGLLVEGRSTFLVGASGRMAGEVLVSPTDPESRAETASVTDTLPSPRAASRSDLIKYAAATRDWNPIHWDHESGVKAGLGGVVVHGLLQSSWLTQTAALAGQGDRPLESARFRYTAPLHPGSGARIEGSLGEDQVELTLMAGDTATVTGRFQVAT